MGRESAGERVCVQKCPYHGVCQNLNFLANGPHFKSDGSDFSSPCSSPFRRLTRHTLEILVEKKKQLRFLPRTPKHTHLCERTKSRQHKHCERVFCDFFFHSVTSPNCLLAHSCHPIYTTNVYCLGKNRNSSNDFADMFYDTINLLMFGVFTVETVGEKKKTYRIWRTVAENQI